MSQKNEKSISLADGAGGEKMEKLLSEHILPFFGNDQGEIPLSSLDDSCVVDDIVFTIDSHTVKPVFFPGGDLGSLSVSGTINDLLATGSEPIGLALAMVIPEGYPLDDLERLLESAYDILEKTEISILTGDTKVVEKGDIDEPIFTTAGIGKRHPMMDDNMMTSGGRKTRWLSDDNLNPGDKIIVTGTIGDHGITILSEREGYGFGGKVKSDVSPLTEVMKKCLQVGGIGSAKDPTRGGLANTLNEWADKSPVGIEIEEDKIPIKDWVSSAGEMLGIDPLSIGNEGKFVLAVNPSKAKKVLQALRETEEGRDAAIIGEAKEDIDGVVLKTSVGGKRILEKPVGDPVPRIC
ncbi:MAG: hydrogenase expression/formation protein HypE [Candidatus Thermoplasmatota archaeon]|nr:hydrogenase expression/formation protein HypE [Candidatus Thermoplasmatota archaeon]MBS3791007.1 hydrogenase expression/formation protein HypE [Candidatus Thermoplasmatota archaeon]